MTPIITLGVVGERLDQVQATLADIQNNLRTVNEQALDRRVTSLESTVKWLSRALGGAIIGAISSGILAMIVGR